jgi:hypothetical protein
LDNPVRGIIELIRVGKYIVITVPHRLSPNAKKDKDHKHYFNITYFKKLFKKLNLKYSITIKYRSITKLLPPIKIPHEIMVEVYNF